MKLRVALLAMFLILCLGFLDRRPTDAPLTGPSSLTSLGPRPRSKRRWRKLARRRKARIADLGAALSDESQALQIEARRAKKLAKDNIGLLEDVAQLGALRDKFQVQLAASEDARRKHAEDNARLAAEAQKWNGGWSAATVEATRARDAYSVAQECAGRAALAQAERDTAQARIVELLGEAQTLRQEAQSEQERADMAERARDVMRRERDEARAAVARLRSALGMAHPWPVHDVLARLADAADLLLSEHNFDGHGHEEIRYAKDAARRISAALAGDAPAPLGAV